MSNASATNGNAQASVKKKSQIADVWKRLCRNKTAMLGLVIMILLVLIAILSPIVFDYDNQVIKTDYSSTLQWPSAAHPFGTDELGRDILIRTIDVYKRQIYFFQPSCLCNGCISLQLHQRVQQDPYQSSGDRRFNRKYPGNSGSGRE